MSSWRAPWQNGTYKNQHTEQHKTRRTHDDDATDIQSYLKLKKKFKKNSIPCPPIVFSSGYMEHTLIVFGLNNNNHWH